MSFERYKENPFIENMLIPVKSKKIQLSRLGADENILINQDTGESVGTHVTTFKKVDSDQFVKIFTSHIGIAFDLKAAGIKAFTLLLWAVQHRSIGKDQVDLDKYTLSDFVEAYSDSEPTIKLSLATFKRGINELERAKIIAKTLKAGRYFINPSFVFNGDRVAFTTLIQRKKDTDDEQMNLL